MVRHTEVTRLLLYLPRARRHLCTEYVIRTLMRCRRRLPQRILPNSILLLQVKSILVIGITLIVTAASMMLECFAVHHQMTIDYLVVSACSRGLLHLDPIDASALVNLHSRLQGLLLVHVYSCLINTNGCLVPIKGARLHLTLK